MEEDKSAQATVESGDALVDLTVDGELVPSPASGLMRRCCEFKQLMRSDRAGPWEKQQQATLFLSLKQFLLVAKQDPTRQRENLVNVRTTVVKVHEQLMEAARNQRESRLEAEVRFRQMPARRALISPFCMHTPGLWKSTWRRNVGKSWRIAATLPCGAHLDPTNNGPNRGDGLP